MDENHKNLSELTRALLLGTSLGTVPLTMVGCATLFPYTGEQATTDTQGMSTAPAPAATAENLTEQQLCQAAISAGDAATIERLFTAYPRAGCIPSVLSAMPPSVLGEISPSAIEALPNSTVRRIPRSALAFMQLPPSVRRIAYEGGTSSY